jgi:DNA-binding GntR family transcriptional regulator
MIRQAILFGRYGPGERLKVAGPLGQFGFSAMLLPEALRKLEGEGLVEIEPNRGAIARRLDRGFIEDLFELNTELRVFAIKRDLKTMTLAKLDELEHIANAFDGTMEKGDLETTIRLNRDFGAISKLTDFQRGWELISAFRLRFGYGRGRQQGLAREKRLIIEALRRQDSQLAEAVFRTPQPWRICCSVSTATANPPNLQPSAHHRYREVRNRGNGAPLWGAIGY